MAEMVYRLQAGVTNKPSKTYNDLNKQQTNSTSSAWKTYQNPYFNYQLQYTDRYQIRYQSNDTDRNIFQIELKREHFPTGENISFQGALIGVIANKDNKSINNECDTRPDPTFKNINGVTFNVEQIETTNDLETQASTEITYQLNNNNNGCFLIKSSVTQGTQDMETSTQYALLSEQDLQMLISEMQSIISTFKFTDVSSMKEASITILPLLAGMSVPKGSELHVTWKTRGSISNVGIGFCPQGQEVGSKRCTSDVSYPNTGSANVGLMSEFALNSGEWVVHVIDMADRSVFGKDSGYFTVQGSSTDIADDCKVVTYQDKYYNGVGKHCLDKIIIKGVH